MVEEVKKASGGWFKYLLIGFLGIIALIFLFSLKISKNWVYIVIGLAVAYFVYKFLMWKSKHKDIYDMLKEITSKELKRGVRLNDNWQNVDAEQFGRDVWGFYFKDLDRTWYYHVGIGVIGTDLRFLPQVRDDTESSSVNRLLALGRTIPQQALKELVEGDKQNIKGFDYT